MEHRKEPRILVITPCHNEEDYLPKTADCMEKQVLKPTLWLIVNDGSSDKTGEIAENIARKNRPWVNVIHREKRKEREVGPGVIDAFYAGLDTVNIDDFEYLCKFDADLEFGPYLFQGLVEKMEQNPKLGTVSGKAVEKFPDGKLKLLRTSNEFSLGACKFYRVQAFKDIGGFVREVMWDGIDCHKCRMKGWEAKSYLDEKLRVLHLRQMGSSHKSIFHGRRRWGKGQYFMGTHPLYILGISVYRMLEPPWILGGLNILIGYILAWLKGEPRYEDLEFRRYLRAWQLKKLGLSFLIKGPDKVSPSYI